MPKRSAHLDLIHRIIEAERAGRFQSLLAKHWGSLATRHHPAERRERVTAEYVLGVKRAVKRRDRLVAQARSQVGKKHSPILVRGLRRLGLTK